jgi:twinkle protein
LVLRKGIRGVILDPWNYIEHKYKAGQTETNYVSEALTKISAFCKRHQVHMLIVAHPRKLQKTNGKYELVTLNDIAGSGNFWAKTDNGISIHRDGELVQVYVQKVRYSWLGKLGMCEFTFDKDRRKYVPMGEPDPFMKQIPDNPYAGISKKDNSVPF